MTSKILLIAILIFVSGCSETYYSSERRAIDSFFDTGDELCGKTTEKFISGAYKISWWNSKLTIYCTDNTEIKIKYTKNDD